MTERDPSKASAASKVLIALRSVDAQFSDVESRERISTRHDIRRIRQLGEGEVRSLHDAADLLDFLQPKGSSFWALAGEHNDVCDAYIRASIAVGTSTPDVHAPIAELQRRYKSWLAAFRAYTDRTTHWVSRAYGESSGERAALRGLFSEEFDANFAYRLADQLRNVSEHGAEVMNAIRVVSSRGQSVPTLHADIDCQKIAEADTKRRLRGATRAEMIATSRPLGAGLIAAAVMKSCERIHVGIVEVLADHIDAAVAALEAVRNEVAADELALIADAESLATAHMQPFSLWPIPTVNRDGIGALRQSASELRSQGPTIVNPDDLIEP